MNSKQKRSDSFFSCRFPTISTWHSFSSPIKKNISFINIHFFFYFILLFCFYNYYSYSYYYFYYFTTYKVYIETIYFINYYYYIWRNKISFLLFLKTKKKIKNQWIWSKKTWVFFKTLTNNKMAMKIFKWFK